MSAYDARAKQLLALLPELTEREFGNLAIACADQAGLMGTHMEVLKWRLDEVISARESARANLAAVRAGEPTEVTS